MVGSASILVGSISKFSAKIVVEPIELADVDGEMPTVDPRIASLDYEYVFMACFDKSQKDNGGQAIWYVTVKNDLTLGGSTTVAVK
jgi:hypothetical protein